LINDPNRPELVNIGNRAEVTIGDLVQRVAARFDYQGPILWDHSPEREGQHRKPSGSSYDPGFNWTDLDTGLGEVCGWFSQHYPKIRGIHQ
jgi:nucleoside-diphosphate-sugar epimerase